MTKDSLVLIKKVEPIDLDQTNPRYMMEDAVIGSIGVIQKECVNSTGSYTVILDKEYAIWSLYDNYTSTSKVWDFRASSLELLYDAG